MSQNHGSVALHRARGGSRRRALAWGEGTLPLGSWAFASSPVLHRPQKRKKKVCEHFPLNIIETGVW